jgi:Holliday junction resolvase RusA-like endonuclease
MGSKSPFVGHSSDMSDVRDSITEQLYEEYSKKFDKPIDFPIEMRYIFYVPAQGEPDLDNLAAIVLDAIQGKVVGKGKNKHREMSMLVDDDLVLRQVETKIVVRKADLEELGPLRTELAVYRYVENNENWIRDYFGE